MPANNPNELSAALSWGADAIVVDLEDSVPEWEKVEARGIAAEYVETHSTDALIYVRINACDTPFFGGDVAAVVGHGLAGVQLPKAKSAEDVLELDRLISEAEAAHGMPEGSVEVVVTIESAAGILRAHEIVSASSRVTSVMPAIGENGDLQCDLGYLTTANDWGSLYTRSRLILAARAAGAAQPLDGAYVGLDDEGFVRSATLARQLGYRGKKVAHGRHVAAANRVFT